MFRKRFVAPRSKISVFSVGRPRTIFQTNPPLKDITLQDVEELIECSVSLNIQNKKDYFASHGIDYDRVQTYYQVVSYLNRCYDRPYFAPQLQQLEEQMRIVQILFHWFMYVMFD